MFSGSFPTALIEKDTNNVSPRLSAAWRGPGQIQYRGSWEIQYNDNTYSGIARRLAQQPPFATTGTNIGGLSQRTVAGRRPHRHQHQRDPQQLRHRPRLCRRDRPTGGGRHPAAAVPHVRDLSAVWAHDRLEPRDRARTEPGCEWCEDRRRPAVHLDVVRRPFDPRFGHHRASQERVGWIRVPGLIHTRQIARQLSVDQRRWRWRATATSRRTTRTSTPSGPGRASSSVTA